MTKGIGPSPEANALITLGENDTNLADGETYMMNIKIATLHIVTNPLFSPNPTNPCATTAINTEVVRSFFLPTRYMLWASANRQKVIWSLALTSIRKIGGKVMTTFTTVTRIEI